MCNVERCIAVHVAYLELTGKMRHVTLYTHINIYTDRVYTFPTVQYINMPGILRKHKLCNVDILTPFQ